MVASLISEARTMYLGAWERLGQRANELTRGRTIPRVSVAQRRQALAMLNQGTNAGKGEHIKWINANKGLLRELHSTNSVAWLYAFRTLLAECGMKIPKPHDSQPWVEWYFAIIGTPPRDHFGGAEEWAVTLWHYYFKVMKEWRADFETLWMCQHTNHDFASGPSAWRDWHFHQVIYGLDALWEAWEREESATVIDWDAVRA